MELVAIAKAYPDVMSKGVALYTSTPGQMRAAKAVMLGVPAAAAATGALIARRGAKAAQKKAFHAGVKEGINTTLTDPVLRKKGRMLAAGLAGGGLATGAVAGGAVGRRRD